MLRRALAVKDSALILHPKGIPWCSARVIAAHDAEPESAMADGRPFDVKRKWF